jgi:hypothetical protein
MHLPFAHLLVSGEVPDDPISFFVIEVSFLQTKAEKILRCNKQF